MPDERFDDLDREPSAADRLAERDQLDAREADAEPEPERRSRPFVAFAGLVLVLLVSLAALELTFDDSPGTSPSGVSGLPRGDLLPDAAAPLASGDSEDAANIIPAGAPPEAGRAACSVRAPGVINLCDLRVRPMAVSFVVLRGTECESALDVYERLGREFPRVASVAVVSGESRAEVQEVARRHRLTVPVAVDPDGALINAFRLGVCPAMTFAGPGGRVTETLIGARALDEARLRAGFRRLARDSG